MKTMNSRAVTHSIAPLLVMLAISLMPELAFAQNTDGAPFLQKLKDWWFGPIGLGVCRA